MFLLLGVSNDTRNSNDQLNLYTDHDEQHNNNMQIETQTDGYINK